MANSFIRKLSGFANLGASEIAALEGATNAPLAYGARQDLIREGDAPGPVFVVLEGWAFRYKVLPSGARQIVAFLMPGDACDLHTSMLASMDHSIQTATRARISSVSRVDMDALMDRFPAIARAMYVAQLVDEGTLRAWIVSLGRRNSTERVAHLLLELYARAVRIGVVRQDEMDFPLSQMILADALGMSPVHINRVLQELRRSNALILRRSMLTIKNPATLIKMSGFDENYLHRRLNTKKNGNY